MSEIFRRKQCGDIREIIVFPDAESVPNPTDEDSSIARIGTVEFQTKESIPAALTKDKKRIDEQELSVEPAWKATLFVNNYPESFDQDQMRSLFEMYGRILDLRWPSKRFKATRRFCYIQFASSVRTLLFLSMMIYGQAGRLKRHSLRARHNKHWNRTAKSSNQGSK